MTTTANQPVWKLVANLGDADPLGYGGYFVFRDETGVYAPEAVYWHDMSDQPEDAKIAVYRFCLDRCTFENGILSDNQFHPEHAAWFADDLPRVAQSIGMDIDELRGALCSSDPRDLAMAYRAIGEYHGMDNLDTYPAEFAPDELAAKIAQWLA